MRLLTHNLLVCNVKACVETANRDVSAAKNFPLKIVVAEDGLKQEESEFNAEFIAHLLPKLDWPALRQTAGELGIADLPPALPERPADDEALLKSIHDLIMDIHLVTGELVCPNCARRYPVTNSIPNMLLRDDEL